MITSHQKQELKALFDKLERSLAVAESLTSGLVQAEIGSISGSSTFYLGGMTAYTIPAKVRYLGVDQQHAESVNAVSARVVEEMATGVCSMFGSQIGISTTGYAEPDHSRDVEVPFAYIGLYDASNKTTMSKKIVGESLTRNEMRQRVAIAVIHFLLDHLQAQGK